MSKDLFAKRIAPRMSNDDIDSAIQEFLNNGGQVKKLINMKNIKKPKIKEGAIPLCDDDEMFLED